MKIAITGCYGRVGRPTVKAALALGHSVVGIDVTTTPSTATELHLEAPAWQTGCVDFVYHQSDISHFDTVLDLLKGCDAVIHLAGLSKPGDFKVETHNCNVVLSWNVLRACAELGITRVAQASSVNVLAMVFSCTSALQYFPIDEDHPCTPDEPYGLSKVISEAQASSIVRRFPQMRVASLRLSWSVPTRSIPAARNPFDNWTARDLWGYVQEDPAADAFLRAVDAVESEVTVETNGHKARGVRQGGSRWQWTGHEAFFIVAPEIAHDGDSKELREGFWPDVPVKEGKVIEGKTGFFDCSKAKEYLGWVHTDQ